MDCSNQDATALIWRKDFVELNGTRIVSWEDGKERQRRVLTSRGIFVIQSARLEDAGLYSCTAYPSGHILRTFRLFIDMGDRSAEVLAAMSILEKKRQHKKLETDIRRLFSTQKAFIPAVLRLQLWEDDVADIVGQQYMDVCRPGRGGYCSRVLFRNNDGTIREVVTSCVHREQLLPRERPFVCQNITNPQLFQTVTCCKSASFCNDFEFPVELGLAEHAQGSDGDGWSLAPEYLYFLLLVLVSVLFSALGLWIGIFYCSQQKFKALFGRLFGWVGPCSRQTLDRLRPRNRNETTNCASSNSHLDRLMEEATMSTGSGAGAPMLAERTIARQITLKHRIGRGGFGDVQLGEWRNEPVAVKIFMSRKEFSWARETAIYRSNMLRHPNLLRWIASDTKDTGTSTQLWLITEYCKNGSLYEHLEQHTLTAQAGLQFIRSIAHGLAYLHTEVAGLTEQYHKPAIAHGDIKPGNILIKNDWTCCIGDLGMGILFEKNRIDKPRQGDKGGTARYLAPEFLTNSFNHESFNAYLQMDIYALALVIWEICRRMSVPTDSVPSFPYEVPYWEYVHREPSPDEMAQCVCVEGRRPSIPVDWLNSKILFELTRVIEESWSAVPQARLTALHIRCTLDRICAEGNVSIIT
uniref:receptor protein serine/threonine kinase n=1 Tax=Globodera pallida TaxID=36090 RepID=A0A183BVB6_GLOPA